MRIAIAPDSFKGSASAAEVCAAIRKGLIKVWPDADYVTVPMADGGEGTVDALVSAESGSFVSVDAHDPLGRPVAARYGLINGGDTAVIETAAASGLTLLNDDERDPSLTSTFGTGEIFRDALGRGTARIIVGVGGSATNDAGAGAAQALGYRLLDANGVEIAAGGAELKHVTRIDSRGAHPGLAATSVVVACDVDNPLCGPHGASITYGPQKGASPKQAQELDAALAHYATIMERDLGVQVAELPGAGAAGGLGAGLVAFAGAELRRGAEVVAEACDLERKLHGADLVITGEGRLDAQTFRGKTPYAVARMAKQLDIPVVAFAGTVDAEACAESGSVFDEAIAICEPEMDRSDCMRRVFEVLSAKAEEFASTWKTSGR